MPARYRAPTTDRAVLADPPRETWPRIALENQRRLDTSAVRVGGLPLRDFRRLARTEIAPEAEDGPLVLSGHQPELFHPGVWVKNFALHHLAEKLGGTALNLVVDNDTLKTPSLRIPTWIDRDPASVRLQSLAFDIQDYERPYESRGIDDAELFRSFANRAAPLWKDWGFEPLLPRVWACVLENPSPNIGERFALVRRCFEREWGCANRELPVSQIAATSAFGRFVRHIVEDLPRFRDVYNRVVNDYRELHGIRSRNHPVPDLAEGEAPFWLTSDATGRRGRLLTSESVDPSRVRPRALTLTMFARLCLGDYFIHGIGGGKYDEVTDAIIRDYFGIEPPRFGVLSATLYLPVPGFPHTLDDVHRLARQERDLTWNPQRYTEDGEALKTEKARLIATEPTQRIERKQWFRDLRAVTERLRPFVTQPFEDTHSALASARIEAEANAIVRRRDYSWVLYPEEGLRGFLQSFL